MNTSYWGPHAWRMIHYWLPKVASPEAFMHALAALLPCNLCRESVWHMMKRAGPLPAADADAGTRYAWTVRLHNAVNAKLGRAAVHDVPLEAWTESTARQSGTIFCMAAALYATDKGCAAEMWRPLQLLATHCAASDALELIQWTALAPSAALAAERWAVYWQEVTSLKITPADILSARINKSAGARKQTES